MQVSSLKDDDSLMRGTWPRADSGIHSTYLSGLVRFRAKPANMFPLESKKARTWLRRRYSKLTGFPRLAKRLANVWTSRSHSRIRVLMRRLKRATLSERTTCEVLAPLRLHGKNLPCYSGSNAGATMSRVRVESFTISLDGYGARPNQDLENPLAWVVRFCTSGHFLRVRFSGCFSELTAARRVSTTLGLAKPRELRHRSGRRTPRFRRGLDRPFRCCRCCPRGNSLNSGPATGYRPRDRVGDRARSRSHPYLDRK